MGNLEYWTMVVVLLYSGWQWLENMRFLRFRFIDAMDRWAKLDEHPQTSRPLIRSEAEIKADRYIHEFSQQMTRAITYGGPRPTWEPQRAGILQPTRPNPAREPEIR